MSPSISATEIIITNVVALAIGGLFGTAIYVFLESRFKSVSDRGKQIDRVVFWTMALVGYTLLAFPYKTHEGYLGVTFWPWLIGWVSLGLSFLYSSRHDRRAINAGRKGWRS